MPRILQTLERCSIYLKSPTAKNESAKFSLIERLPDGKTRVYRSEAIDSINQLFRSGKLTFIEAQLACKDVIHQLSPKRAVLFNEANKRLLNQYWEEEYADREIVDVDSAWNRLVRAVDAVGSYSLLSASRRELQNAVNKNYAGNKQREIISTLNQILRHFRVNVKLKRAREEFHQVRSVTEEEFQKILTHLESDFLKLLCAAAFGSGCRAGELFALEPQSLSGRELAIYKQADYDKVIRQTKNRKPRVALMIKGYEGYMKQWIAISIEERLKHRKMSFSKKVRHASKKALGRAITFHDLRHSYSVYWLSKGLPIYDVATFLGDTVAVVEKYYAGFIATPESLSRAAKL